MKILLCNCPPDQAERLARVALEARAACVNLIPGVRSLYVWAGEVCDEGETTLVIKVAEAAQAAVRAALIAAHPYDVPEVIAVAVDEAASHGPYVAWVRAAAEEG